MNRVRLLGFNFFRFRINDDKLEKMNICLRHVRVINLGHDALREREPDFRFERRARSDALFAGGRPLRVLAGRTGRESLSRSRKKEN